MGATNVKKLLNIVLTLSLLSLGAPIAHAATDDCPGTWKIDTTSRAGYDELLQAKARLGADLALSEPVTQYSNYSGELGAMAAPKDRGNLTIEDIYLYGKTQVQWKVGVQKKNCPGITNFVINVGTLSDSFGVKVVNTNVDTQTWANSNEGVFIDFTKAAQFGACIKALQTRFSPPNIGIELQGSTLLVPSLNLRLRQANFQIPCGTRSPLGITYQDLSPECRSYTESFDRSVAIKKGASCDIALSLLYGGILEIFPRYSLKSKDFEVVVTCAKGRLIKKFTTYKGYEFRVKCPTGYKKR
jgi:hypothetical protein